MRYRELEGWADAREAVEYLWRWAPREIWDVVGDAEAPADLRFLSGSGEVMMAASRLGLAKTRQRT